MPEVGAAVHGGTRARQLRDHHDRAGRQRGRGPVQCLVQRRDLGSQAVQPFGGGVRCVLPRPRSYTARVHRRAALAIRLARCGGARRRPGPGVRRRRTRPGAIALCRIDGGSLRVGSAARRGPPEPAWRSGSFDLPSGPLLVFMVAPAYRRAIAQTRDPILVVGLRMLVIALETGSSAGGMRMSG